MDVVVVRLQLRVDALRERAQGLQFSWEARHVGALVVLLLAIALLVMVVVVLLLLLLLLLLLMLLMRLMLFCALAFSAW